MFNLLTGGKITLTLFIILILVVTGFSLSIVYYRAEVKTLQAGLKEEQLKAILYKDSLAQANKSIEKQNKAIEQIKLDTATLQVQLEQEQNETERLRQAQIDRANFSLSVNDSCETQLAIIKRTQERYFYDKERRNIKTNK